MNTRSMATVPKAQTPKSSFTPTRSSLLQRKCACGGSSGLTGSCAECDSKKLSSQPPLIQRKLTIGQPNDRYEQEADRVADQVMRMPDHRVIGGQSSTMGNNIQRAVTPSPLTHITPPVHGGRLEGGKGEGNAPSIVQDVLSSSGQPLDPGTRAFFEPRFGHDFSHVRVHTDFRAAESARSVNALAYTVGRDVVFGSGQYAPGTSAGQRLLGHELTHVVQQGGGNNSVVHRWAVGPAPAPAGFSVITDPEHLRRLDQAETIVRGVLPSRRCQTFFSGGCGAPTALQDAFDNARVYLMPVDDNVFGARRRPGTDIAFNLRAFRIGRFMIASTLLHEMFHTCDPTVDQNTRELNSENAVETCRLHTPWIDTVSPGRGAVGSRVTILGWGFGPTQGATDEVRIGGVTAPIISWVFTTDNSSRVRIVADVPAGVVVGNADVVVINNRVTSNTGRFTVV